LAPNQALPSSAHHSNDRVETLRLRSELFTGLEAVDERSCASLPRHFVSVVALVHTRLIELHEGSMNSGTASNDPMIRHFAI
jgi:hypothetical protein